MQRRRQLDSYLGSPRLVSGALQSLLLFFSARFLRLPTNYSPLVSRPNYSFNLMKLNRLFWVLGNCEYLANLAKIALGLVSRLTFVLAVLFFISGMVRAAAPAPTGLQITSFTLSSPLGGSRPFTLGLGFKKGDIVGSPTLNIANSQVTVMRRWNDGSVKHAIASGRADLTAGVPLSVGVYNAASAATGVNLTAADIQAANPQASISFGALGTVNLVSLLASPYRTFISGPEMVEAHYVAQVGTDATLLAWFHVRLYKGGAVWIRFVGANGYLDINTASKSYIPTVTIGGVQVWNNGGAALTHYAYTRWTQEGWIGGDPQVTPFHDTNYLKATKLVPNYLSNTPSATTLNGLYQNYAPNQNGNWTSAMGGTGYQDQIGLLPTWDALYITSNADARAYKSVIANAKAINSYSIVWSDSLTKAAIRPTDRYNWSFLGKDQGGGSPPSAGLLSWEGAHFGSAGYLAYLITGDYYHLETMENQSATTYLGAGTVNWTTNPASNNYGTSRYFNGQTRGYAWSLRSLSQHVGIAPAGNAIAADYGALLANNITHLKAIKDTVNPSGIGYLYEYDANLYAVGTVSPWQQHFFIQSLGHGSDIEPLGDMTAYNDVRNYLYRAVVGILGDSSGYCFTEASTYTLKSNDGTSANPNGWYKSWAQVYSATFAAPTVCGNTLGGSSGGAPSGASGGYWGNLLPAIAYAVDHGAPGADASWARLTGSSNWGTVLNSGFGDTPNWGIIPRGTVSSPPPIAPTISFSATPGTIASGASATLTWSSSNANTCTASNGWSGIKSTSGTLSVAPAVTTTYILDCSGPAGSATQSATVTVSAAASLPTVALSVTPTSIASGASATITWSSTNVTGCTASNGWAGAKPASGTQTVTPTVNATYTLLCTGAGGAVTQSATVVVNSGSVATIPSTPGWYQIPNTKLRTVCPSNNFGGSAYPFADACPNVVAAWNSGVMDTTKNRLLVWGGGHNDYYGNEVYALNLNTLSVERLTNPSPPNIGGPCGLTTLSDGRPNSRHTYDGLAYLPNVEKMFVLGGVPACAPGGYSDDTWMLDLGTLVWEKVYEHSPVTGPAYLNVTAYDPNTGKVFVLPTGGAFSLHAYDPVAKTYTKLNASGIATDYHMTAVVDPNKKKLVIVGGGGSIGGGVIVIDIGPGSTYQVQRPTTTGGDAIVNSNYPGLAFDPTSNRIVAWNGGDTVYSLDLDTNVWTPLTFLGGPGPAQLNGTSKRWSYSPASGVFVVINSMDQNAYTLRLGASTIDSVPDAFSFTTQNGSVLNAVVTSNVVTPIGFNAPASIAVLGGSYSISGGPFVTTPGTINPGQTVTVRLTTSGTPSTTSTVTLTIGGVTGAFSVTTQGVIVDTIPDAFSFTSQNGAILNAVVTSNTLTPLGYNTVAPVSISAGASYSINGGPFVSATGTISPGQSIAVKVTASGLPNTTVTGTLTIGGVAGSFVVTTLAAATDSVPDQFTFAAQGGVALSNPVNSNVITPTGYNSPATISVSAGGSYSVNGGPYQTVTTTISPGQTVSLRQTSSNAFGTTTSVTLSIGGVTGVFKVTTQSRMAKGKALAQYALSSMPTVTLTATQTSLISGGSATLNWSSTNATSCAASGGWSGVRTPSGSLSTGPLTATTSFVLTCIGDGGSAVGSATVTVALPPGSVIFSTNFAGTENPISESGAWISGDLNGLDWNNPQTASGRAYASLLSGATGNRYDDSVAHLHPSIATFTPNQFAQATVYRVAGYSPTVATGHEVELFLRFQITPHNARGYVVYWGHSGYLGIARWNGSVGDFTSLADLGSPGIGAPVDGDVLRAEISGSVIRVYKNGQLVLTAPSDTTWADGQPGMGFWPVDTAIPQNLGWKNFAAGNL